MSTPYNDFYDRFFKKIEEDTEFFQYYNLTPDESMALAKERAKTYLQESLAKLTLDSTNDVDFNDYDDMLETVTLDCTKTEIDIIANLMFEMYLFRDVAKLKSYETSFTPKDLTVFSSSESRKSFMSMYNEIVSKNINMIDAYNSKDRLTGKRKTVDYTQYYEV